jgi:hypothetical protein
MMGWKPTEEEMKNIRLITDLRLLFDRHKIDKTHLKPIYKTLKQLMGG